ncbi:MAG TPA: DivIVA domain-containing protein [Clostridia bacterium]|nr:DivIVA domain-containing protein [Clostridia bacterium]
MLTPLDIHNQEFKRSLRGYDVDEVDEFLDEIIRDFEYLYKENLELKETIQKRDEEVNRYQELEQTLQETLVLAQQTGEEIKQNAKKEAELIIWEAQKKAEQILAKAEAETFTAAEMLEKMHGLEKQLYVKMKSFLTSQLEFLEEYEIGINTEEVKETDESTAGSGNFW